MDTDRPHRLARAVLLTLLPVGLLAGILVGATHWPRPTPAAVAAVAPGTDAASEAVRSAGGELGFAMPAGVTLSTPETVDGDLRRAEPAGRSEADTFAHRDAMAGIVRCAWERILLDADRPGDRAKAARVLTGLPNHGYADGWTADVGDRWVPDVVAPAAKGDLRRMEADVRRTCAPVFQG